MLNHDYNPDVLNCLANLSNDEVFTPPVLANRMIDLLPEELFHNPKTTFLDPFCKSGVFLREIVKRLDVGLQEIIPDRQERIDHILHKQVFGIAITELTSYLSRRSVYCSKSADNKYSVSHFDKPEGNIKYHALHHTWENGKCKYCGASQSVYDRGDDAEQYAYQFIHTDNPKTLFNMKFDVIIGNPPYQLDDGGNGASAKPIFHLFVNQAKKLNPRYLSLIIPARWFAGGKGLDSFRDEMLHDDRLREIHDYNNASDCFPGVEIKGGVCFFLWDRDNRGLCDVFTHKEDNIVSQMERPLLEENCDIFIRHNNAINILKKIQQFREESFSSIVSTRKPFGFATNFSDFGTLQNPNYVKLYANQKQGFVDKKLITKNIDWVDKYKLLIPKAVGSGDMSKDWIKPILSGKNECCTETYIIIGPFENKEITQNVYSYTQTKFFHLLLGLKKITQDTTQKVYQFVPMQDFSHPWTDEMLYKKYGLTEEEIAFIESMIKPME